MLHSDSLPLVVGREFKDRKLKDMCLSSFERKRNLLFFTSKATNAQIITPLFNQDLEYLFKYLNNYKQIKTNQDLPNYLNSIAILGISEDYAKSLYNKLLHLGMPKHFINMLNISSPVKGINLFSLYHIPATRLLEKVFEIVSSENLNANIKKELYTYVELLFTDSATKNYEPTLKDLKELTADSTKTQKTLISIRKLSKKLVQEIKATNQKIKALDVDTELYSAKKYSIVCRLEYSIQYKESQLDLIQTIDRQLTRVQKYINVRSKWETYKDQLLQIISKIEADTTLMKCLFNKTKEINLYNVLEKGGIILSTVSNSAYQYQSLVIATWIEALEVSMYQKDYRQSPNLALYLNSKVVNEQSLKSISHFLIYGIKYNVFPILFLNTKLTSHFNQADINNRESIELILDVCLTKYIIWKQAKDGKGTILRKISNDAIMREISNNLSKYCLSNKEIIFPPANRLSEGF